MKNRWAKGIPPRNFTWVIKDSLAVSERPGGYARNHRRVRRQEEIIWIRQEAFDRVVSLLGSPHNLHAYEELGMPWAHFPFGPGEEPGGVLPDLFGQLDEWVAAGQRVLLHEEEVGDRVMGVVAGYLLWSKRLPGAVQAVMVIEQLFQKQMGPEGRSLVNAVDSMA